MRGSGRGEELPEHLRAPHEEVSFYAPDLSSALTTLRPGTRFGPEITFGRGMAERLPAGPLPKLAIIKHARGGTSIRDHWTPGGDATTAGDGADYVAFQTTVTAGLDALAIAYPQVSWQIAGILWQQGERDVVLGGTASSEYEVNFRSLIHDMRATYGSQLPFVFGRLSQQQTNLTDPGRGTPMDFALVREAQQRVHETEPTTQIVDTDTFSLLPDRLHFDTLGQQQLGTAMALAMQELLAVPEPCLGGWLPAFFVAFLALARRRACPARAAHRLRGTGPPYAE